MGIEELLNTTKPTQWTCPVLQVILGENGLKVPPGCSGCIKNSNGKQILGCYYLCKLSKSDLLGKTEFLKTLIA